MRTRRRPAFYNVMFPLWMLIWFPSWLWLLLIPANYLIDRLVLWWSLGSAEDRQQFCRQHTWKICLAGFASDFAGSLLLLGASLSASSSPPPPSRCQERASMPLTCASFARLD